MLKLLVLGCDALMKKLLIALATTVTLASVAHAETINLVCTPVVQDPTVWDQTEKGRTSYLTVDLENDTVRWTYDPEKPGKVHPIFSTVFFKRKLTAFMFGEKQTYEIIVGGEFSTLAKRKLFYEQQVGFYGGILSNCRRQS
jgi:hypothetical protein